MRFFDIFRHGEDDDFGNLTQLAGTQIKRLAQLIRHEGIRYEYFICSLYKRCVETLNLLLDELGLRDGVTIFDDVNLCTQEPERWNNLFASKIFQDVLPVIGTKMAAGFMLAPDLLKNDAEHLLTELKKITFKVPNETWILGISHNTMLLAAEALVNKFVVTPKTIKSINECKGIRFFFAGHEIKNTKRIG